MPPSSGALSQPATALAARPHALGDLAATLLVLAKLRVSALVVFTGVVAALVATRGQVPPLLLGGFALSGLLGAAGAAMLNHYLDRDLDARMERTRRRPLPAGAVAPRTVLVLGLATLALAVLLAAQVHPRLPGWILLAAFTYVGLYTWWLKRRVASSVVIGGWTGSCAVLAGWELGGAPLALDAWALAALVFLWTPGHFWALAIARQADYARGAVPTLPSVVGPARAAGAVVWSALGSIGAALVPWATATLGGVYLLVLVGAGAAWLWLADRARREPTPRRAWSAYKLSGLFLLLTFGGMLLDLVVR